MAGDEEDDTMGAYAQQVGVVVAKRNLFDDRSRQLRSIARG